MLTPSRAVVLMVVQPSEDTVLDQRKMEYDLLLRYVTTRVIMYCLHGRIVPFGPLHVIGSDAVQS